MKRFLCLAFALLCILGLSVCPFAAGSNELPPIPSFIKGDVNRNGKVDSNDAITLRSIVLQLETAPQANSVMRVADINGNGKLDSNDYVRIRMHLLGILNVKDTPNG